MNFPEGVANKIKKIFTDETLEKVSAARLVLSSFDDRIRGADSFKDIYITFHSLKGTGKSVGYGEITQIAALALDTTLRAMDGKISIKLFKAKTEASLCEIEEVLAQDPAGTWADISEEANAENSNGTVLVVDDDLSLVMAIKERLSIEGFAVVEATTLEDAAALLSERLTFDLMIIDIVMPGGDGFELCQKIRKENNYDDTPVIFLTAEASTDFMMRGFEIGADDYLIKPISLDELAVKVRATISRTRRYRDRLMVDELTGAYNRFFLKIRFAEEEAKSRRDGKPFGFCILDLDCFKRINDTYGHISGDRVLVEFVEYLKQSIRPLDAVIRFGGEEFILLLSEVQQRQAYETMNRLREGFSGHVFKAGEKAFSVTFSAGVAIYPKDGTSLEDLLAQADSILYTAKQSGRNKICCCSGR